MKIFKKIKNYFNKSPTTFGKEIKMINMNTSTFVAWNGDIYNSDVIRACIRPFANAVGKLEPKHIVEKENDLKFWPWPYMKMLLKEPNPIMTWQMLQEKMAINLKLNNNAFAHIARDENDKPVQIIPLDAMTAQGVIKDDGSVGIKFNLRGGKMVIIDYENIIHMRKDYYNDMFMGSSNHEVLAPLLEIVNTTDQGIVKAIKNSSVIRWLLKLSTPSLKSEALKKNAKDFADNFLSTESDGSGVAAVAGNMDAIQIDSKDFVPNAAQMDKTVTRIYNFFGSNEKIVQSKYTEDDWNAYYESEIEPYAIQFANELTRKLFTRNERAFGNNIIMESASLQYASMTTKLNLANMVDRGAMTPNEWRRVLNLGPIEGGEKAIRRLDTAIVDGGEINEN